MLQSSQVEIILDKRLVHFQQKLMTSQTTKPRDPACGQVGRQARETDRETHTHTHTHTISHTTPPFRSTTRTIEIFAAHFLFRIFVLVVVIVHLTAFRFGLGLRFCIVVVVVVVVVALRGMHLVVVVVAVVVGVVVAVLVFLGNVHAHGLLLRVLVRIVVLLVVLLVVLPLFHGRLRGGREEKGVRRRMLSSTVHQRRLPGTRREQGRLVWS